ncbi:hypothetical protein RFI_37604, partial [Reticulomyxa filosa]
PPRIENTIKGFVFFFYVFFLIKLLFVCQQACPHQKKLFVPSFPMTRKKKIDLELELLAPRQSMIARVKALLEVFIFFLFFLFFLFKREEGKLGEKKMGGKENIGWKMRGKKKKKKGGKFYLRKKKKIIKKKNEKRNKKKEKKC